MRYTLYTKPSHHTHKGAWSMFPNASLHYDDQQRVLVNQSGTPYDIDRALDNGILVGKIRNGDKIAAIAENHPAFNMILFNIIMYDCLDSIEDRDRLDNVMTSTLNKLTTK